MKKIFVIGISLVLLVIMTGCGNKKNIDQNNQNNEVVDKENTNKEFNEDKNFGDYKIYNIKMHNNGEINIFTATLQNISENLTPEKLAHIVFMNDKNEEMYKMTIFIKALEPGQSIDINSNISVDVIDSNNFTLTE